MTCYSCDADYDGCTGYDKAGGGARAQLIRYYAPEPVPEPPKVVELTPQEKMLNHVKNKIDEPVLSLT